MYDVIVIGGGIVGTSLAYHLVRQGARTMLIDRHDPGRATDAGAGILGPELTSRRSESWFTFAVEAVAYYPTLVEQLQADGAADTSYAVCGKITVAVGEDELKTFAETEQLVFTRQAGRGTPSSRDLYLIDSAEARRLFPPLAPLQRAIYYRQAARVDGRLLNVALLQAAVRQGLTVKQASVERLLLDGYLVDGVEAAGQTIGAGTVVIAGGAWSDAFESQLAVHIPVEPQRGQIIHLHLPGTETGHWPIVGSRKGFYLVSWPGGRVVVGATRERGAGFQAIPTVAGIREVLDEALWVAPGLAAAEIKEIRVGLRPRTPDRSPVLGTIPGVDNLFVATGHGATGLQTGPFSGKVMAEVALGSTVETDISAFDVRRFL